MKYTVGSVPYLNAKPLVKPFQWAGAESPVQVVFDVPSRLPALLDSGGVQAIMVSSYAALTTPGATVAAGLSIGTQREVLSVRLFSKVPFARIRTLAEDASSMTSNALARIILSERFDVLPSGGPAAPSLTSMLAENDACVLIGDNGMRADESELHVLDLGFEWFQLTELPFVWAVWMGGEELTPQLVTYLQGALVTSRADLARVIREASAETGFTLEQCRRYLQDIMDYRLDDAHQAGLREYGRMLFKHGLASAVEFPRIVDAQTALSNA
ncbi:MAG TPA: menaquinone biosynthesis protein [Fimbriimonas sp.]|nr:menaquinone biosynthesis protein [Fimbriimonas sp.]